MDKLFAERTLMERIFVYMDMLDSFISESIEYHNEDDEWNDNSEPDSWQTSKEYMRENVQKDKEDIRKLIAPFLPSYSYREYEEQCKEVFDMLEIDVDYQIVSDGYYRMLSMGDIMAIARRAYAL